MVRYYTWKEFDEGVENIANKCSLIKLSGVYGVPRGGLCLAVALSHKLNIELIPKPVENSLIVDDVYETGLTLNNFRDTKDAVFFVLISKKKPTWWNTVNLSLKREWIIFPWENTNSAMRDKNEYKKKRGIF